jgi:hypothetical protein
MVEKYKLDSMKSRIFFLFFLSTFILSCNSKEGKQKADLNNENTINVEQLYISLNIEKYPISKDSLISELCYMKTDTLDCSADVYWKIIKRGKEYIPLLIEGLTDTTKTNIYNYCKKGKLNTGEVCYFALEEIAEFPAYVVTHIEFDLITDGCWNFYEYLYDNKYKQEYQNMVKSFYSNNTYQFEKYTPAELTDCYMKYNITGKYKWVVKWP